MENIGEFARQEGKQSLMREAKTFEVLDVLVKDQWKGEDLAVGPERGRTAQLAS